MLGGPGSKRSEKVILIFPPFTCRAAGQPDDTNDIFIELHDPSKTSRHPQPYTATATDKCLKISYFWKNPHPVIHFKTSSPLPVL